MEVFTHCFTDREGGGLYVHCTVSTEKCSDLSFIVKLISHQLIFHHSSSKPQPIFEALLPVGSPMYYFHHRKDH